MYIVSHYPFNIEYNYIKYYKANKHSIVYRIERDTCLCVPFHAAHVFSM